MARIGSGSSGKTAAGAVRLGNIMSAAITNKRMLGPAEAEIMFSAGLMLLAAAALAIFWPRMITIPIAVVAIWVSASFFLRAYQLYREGKKEDEKLKKNE